MKKSKTQQRLSISSFHYQTSFQLTVGRNYAIAIATLNDWLKNLAIVFQPIENAKPKPTAPCTCDFSRSLSKLQVIARRSDWFDALFAPVVIGEIGRASCRERV